jgi:hypothetical protein
MSGAIYIQGTNGRSSTYTPVDLYREARSVAKQYGSKLKGYRVEINQASGRVSLAVQFENATVGVAL